MPEHVVDATLEPLDLIGPEIRLVTPLPQEGEGVLRIRGAGAPGEYSCRYMRMMIARPSTSCPAKSKGSWKPEVAPFRCGRRVRRSGRRQTRFSERVDHGRPAGCDHDHGARTVLSVRRADPCPKFLQGRRLPIRCNGSRRLHWPKATGLEVSMTTPPSESLFRSVGKSDGSGSIQARRNVRFQGQARLCSGGQWTGLPLAQPCPVRASFGASACARARAKASRITIRAADRLTRPLASWQGGLHVPERLETARLAAPTDRADRCRGHLRRIRPRSGGDPFSDMEAPCHDRGDRGAHSSLPA